jgi:flagellin-like hook-associated protein FlgL
MKINRVEASINELNILNISLNSDLSEIEEVDMAIEAGKYLANQEAYQMTLEATASALQLPSLIDFLK